MKPDEKTLSETDIQTLVEFQANKALVVLDSQVLNALMGCYRLADFRFNHNFQSISGKSNSLEIGSIIHKFLELYYHIPTIGGSKKDAFEAGMLAAELYIQGCSHCTDFQGNGRPSCGHKPDDFPGVRNTPPNDENGKTGWQWALDTCKQYSDFWKDDHWIPLFTERVKSKILYTDDEMQILWKAKIDLSADTNQGIYPVDHKTGKQNREIIVLNPQFIGQTLVSNTNMMIVNKIGLQKTLKPEEKFIRVPVSYNSDLQLEFQSEILPYYASMMIHCAKTGYWPPNYTNCESKFGKCAFYDICKTTPETRQELLMNQFIVGPNWNPTNEAEGE